MTLPPLPAGWPGLRAERDREYYRQLEAFLTRDRAEATVYPPRHQVFRALELTPRASVRVVPWAGSPWTGG